MFHGIGSHFKDAAAGPIGKDSLAGGGARSLTGGQFAAKVAAHAAAGGVMSVLNGGKFGHGFVSAGFVEAVNPAVAGMSKPAQAAASIVVGGTSSVLAGGKFANGAVTASFQLAFNHWGPQAFSTGSKFLDRLFGLSQETSGVDALDGLAEDFGDVATAGSEHYVYGEHGYYLKTAVCTLNTKGCVGLNVALEGERDGAIPFTPMAGVEGEMRLFGWFFPIRHHFDARALTSENQTLPGHIFHDGSVFHRYYAQDGLLYVETYGRGIGLFPAMNKVIGEYKFQNFHEALDEKF